MSRLRLLDPAAGVRARRRLELCEPQIRPFRTADNVDLRLTRFRGGKKGPVLLSHGLGVSSGIFMTDTIEPNLVEYLYGMGYDVWLLDYRASIELAASRTAYDADAIATLDYPAAVEEVRRATGAESIQALVHCFGSTTFFMAMLAGLQGVRSIVASQVATRPLVPPVTRVKAHLRFPRILTGLGLQTLTAYSDKPESRRARLYDRVLAQLPIEPEEQCASRVCHRITFLYGLLYEHDRLSEATHGALHELFGVASLQALDHLAVMVRRGRLVTARGADEYLPRLDRLALPIRFIHGAENACYLPSSTAVAVEELSAANGADLYSRRLIPGYGHIDCILGENAARDVYPFVLEHLEQTH